MPGRGTWVTLFLLALGSLSDARLLAAQDPTELVQFHGFGNWKYARTNVNHFLSGTPGGDYRSANFDLNMAVHPLPHLTIIAQVGFDETSEGTVTDLAFSFAEWKFSDKLRLRAGKIQHAFGIYSEVFDVGTLRPFLTLPSAVYGETGIVSEGFDGISLRGRAKVGYDFSLAYDLYGGGITVAENERPLKALAGSNLGGSDDVTVRDVIGGRLVAQTPVSGLSFGASFYTGVVDSSGVPSRENTVGAHVDYTSDRLWVRTELVRNSERDGELLRGGYVEAAWFVTPRLQVAGQYNRLVTRIPNVDVTVAPWLARHRELAVGLAFWPATEVAVKASLHWIGGNRFAFPAEATAAEFLDPAMGRRNTRLFQAGVQFSF